MRRTITQYFLMISLRRDIYRHPTLVTNFLTTLSITDQIHSLHTISLPLTTKTTKTLGKRQKSRYALKAGWLHRLHSSPSSLPLPKKDMRLISSPPTTTPNTNRRGACLESCRLLFDSSDVRYDLNDPHLSSSRRRQTTTRPLRTRFFFLRGGTCLFVSCSWGYNV